MLKMLELIKNELEAKRACALATIIEQANSAPRGTGARLLANKQGLIAGTTGGGLAEAKAIDACLNACEHGHLAFLDVAMDGTAVANSDLICGGQVRILIEPFLPAPEYLKQVELAITALKSGSCYLLREFPFVNVANSELNQQAPQIQSQVLANVTTQWHIITNADNNLLDTSLNNSLDKAILAEFLALAKADKNFTSYEFASILTLGKATWFVEYCQLAERMFLIGAGHVSLPTAQIANLVGYEVYILDDRQEFANQERFPFAHTSVIKDYANCLQDFQISPRDYLIVITRGHLFDGEALMASLKTSAGYIGMIGSKRKRRQIYEKLEQLGFTKSELENRVHSPIGLEIAAETPEEIAVSILAQCIAHRRAKN